MKTIVPIPKWPSLKAKNGKIWVKEEKSLVELTSDDKEGISKFLEKITNFHDFSFIPFITCFK